MSILLGSSSKDGLSIYRKHHLYAIMLEVLADKQYCLPKNVFSMLTNYVNEEIKWNATMIDINEAVIYLIYIGMIEAREDGSIRITTLGTQALADCRFQQLASNTFFNYRSMKNNELGIIFALFSFVVSLTALIVSAFR